MDTMDKPAFRRVDENVSFCGCIRPSERENKHRPSKRYDVPVSVCAEWWETALLQCSENDAGDVEVFVERLRQLVDYQLINGSRQAVVRLGTTCCECRDGIIKECVVSVLGGDVAYKHAAQKAGRQAAKAARAFYIPATFFDHPERVMCVNPNCVFIATWSRKTGFVVEDVLWVREGKDTASTIARAYWFDVCSKRLRCQSYCNGRKVINGFCDCLFRAAHLSVRCAVRKRPVSACITPESLVNAMKEMEIWLLPGRSSVEARTMHITDGAVVVTFPEQEPITVWEKK